MPPEHRRVEPAIAVRQLHAFGTRRGARRVVHRAGGILVGLPRLRCRPSGGRREQRAVVAPVQAEAVADLDGVHLGVEIGIVQEDRRPGVVDDVGDFVRGQPEVDGYQDATEPTDAEERGEEAG